VDAGPLPARRRLVSAAPCAPYGTSTPLRAQRPQQSRPESSRAFWRLAATLPAGRRKTPQADSLLFLKVRDTGDR
jgi:hypothetical protein